MPQSQKARDIWYRLDNVANIYPSVSNASNTNVYRLCCELHQMVDRDTLQSALDIAIKSFPYFRVTMRRGLFWYYLERSELSPQVLPDTQRPCAPIFFKHAKELLIRVSFFNRRINLEAFHSVADGNGAIQLLNAIVYHYIHLRHRDELPESLPSPLDAMSASMVEDSFGRYYDPAVIKSPFKRRAYTIGSALLPRGDIRVTEATMPTKQILALAKSKGVTATAYLAALLIFSIYKELMPLRAAQKRPIGLTVPVDLRGHFASETSRNFFSVTELHYNFANSPNDFDSVLVSVAEQLKQNQDPQALAARMGYTMRAQKNLAARFTPLFIKDLILKTVYYRTESSTTGVISNMGRIPMPPDYTAYINRYICSINPTKFHRIKVCFCSYQDQFVIAFTSCIVQTGAEKYFIRHLAQNGVDICLTSNGVNTDEIL